MKAFVLLVLLAVLKCFAWREWDYSTETTDEWEDIWGYSEGPRLRRGHSLVIHKDQGRIILFGGRDNNILRAHNPKTYEVVEINGTLEFNNYDQNPVKECTAESSNTTGLEYSFTSTSQEKTANNCSNFAVVGLFYNDVWEYDLDCTRYGDGPCENRGWKVLHAGAKDGGCKYYLGKKICTVPTERWQHGSAVFNDSLVAVYGGYGPACEDYCDDLWLFDLRDNTWTEVYPPGTLSGSEALPGKRWRFSALGDGAAFWVFGGHRLWHGFASDNSAANDWGSTAELPTGGYLNDLWRFDRPLLAVDERVPLLTDDFGNWTRLMPKKVCEADAEGTVTCADGPWPSARASHAAALDAASGGLWVHGGYRTYFPYLWTHGPGSLGGTSAAGAGGFVPYPTYPFFLDDLWFFNFTDETWTEVTPSGDVKPDARMDHSMVKAGDKLILYGGYGDNYYFDETWQFDLATSTWLEKTSFVWPVYPENCTDDLAYIAANNCSEFKWRKDLEWEDEHYANPADRYALRRAWALKAYSDLDFYYPDESYGAFYGTLDKGEAFHADRQLASLYEGMPMGKYQAVAPRQYYTTFQYFYNGSSSATVYQRCTSVWGQPTRDKVTDGLYGRASEQIFIAQPRRQAPGWDGCRDRYDGDEDLENELQWIRPGQRSQQRMVYSSKYDMILMYGGVGPAEYTLADLSSTPEVEELSEFWQLGIHDCPSNCSDHGDCYYGFCFCDDGYYGVDCSNTSCPGDYCYYDDDNVQQCSHCSFAGYEHTDADTYASGLEKIPCSDDVTCYSNGICDGFGTCQCAPPFLGEDCAIKDCKDNCSFHGWCSVEFPVSRCMCNPGYYGEICEYQDCLNNCSYPNGVCDPDTGSCACRALMDPYVNTRVFRYWQGEDCSYLTAYAAAPTLRAPPLLWGGRRARGPGAAAAAAARALAGGAVLAALILALV